MKLYTPCWRSLQSIHLSQRPLVTRWVSSVATPTEDISVPHLVSVGDLTVIDNDRLLVAQFPRLRAVAGGVKVSYNDRLRSFISPGREWGRLRTLGIPVG